MKNIWIDNKGRKVDIKTMSDKWLNNIKKNKSISKEKKQEIINEIKRRKNIRSNN